MYHASCEVAFQPFNRSYSQLTFFIFFYKKTLISRVWSDLEVFRLPRVWSAQMSPAELSTIRLGSTNRTDPTRERAERLSTGFFCTSAYLRCQSTVACASRSLLRSSAIVGQSWCIRVNPCGRASSQSRILVGYPSRQCCPKC